MSRLFASRRSRAALIATAAFVLGLSLFNALQVRSAARAPDDCFITLRYAENLSQGDGFRWNPGGERVEGFSSPLHLLLLTGAIAAGLPPLIISQLSSLLPAMATVLLVLVWGWFRLSPPWAVAAALAVGLSPSFSMWSRGGLETSLFAFLVLAAVVAADLGRRRGLMVILGLMAWTRPEAPLYIGAAAVAVFLTEGRDRHALGRAARVAGGAIAMFVPWLVFRLVYFGHPLANTYYAKMDGVRESLVVRGFDYVGRFLALSEVHTPLIVAVLGLVAGFLTSRLAYRRGMAKELPTWPVFAVLLVLASAAFAVVAGGDWMPQYRFLTPTIPLLAILGAAGAATVTSLVPARPARVAATAVLVLVLLSQPVRIFQHDLKDPHYDVGRPPRLVELDNGRMVARLYRLGLVLGRTQPADAVIALIPAGAIPYASGLTTIDMLGLNDTALAHQEIPDLGTGWPAHEKGDGALILARKPDLIILNHQPSPVFGTPIAPDDQAIDYRPVRQILSDPAFAHDYEPFVVAIDDSTSFTLYRRREG